MTTSVKSEPKGQPTKTKEKENQSKEVLHLSMTFDEKYLTPFTVLLTSILKINAGNVIHVKSIATCLSLKQENQLRNMLRDH